LRIKPHIVFGDKVLLSIPTIAKITGYHPVTLRRLAGEGKITGHKIGTSPDSRGQIWYFERSVVLSQLNKSIKPPSKVAEALRLADVDNYQREAYISLASDL
jgi:hypothetical protein